MGFITQTDIANFLVKKGRLLNEGQINNIAILNHLVKEDRNSKEKKMMYDGMKYFLNKNQIHNKKSYYWVDNQRFEDKEASNQKLPHNFHRVITEEKAGYLVGTPISFSADDVEDKEQVRFQDAVTEILGEDFNEIAPQWVKGATNKGVEWLYVYVDEKGNFRFTVIPAEQCIPIFDSQYMTRLVSMIRYYEVEKIIKGESKVLLKVEWYDENGITYYMQSETDQTGDYNFFLDVEQKPNPEPYWMKFDTGNGQSQALGWDGKIPFIQLPNNDEWVSDLTFYKELIDDYDLQSSLTSDDLKDLQNAIWVLKNYEGTSLREFKENLKKYKAINTDADGGAEPQTLDIPIEAKEKHMARLEADIFFQGMSVNRKMDKFGQNPSGVALRFLYGLLDLKTNITARKMTKSLRTLMELLSIYLKTNTKSEFKGKYNPKKINFVFHRNIIINEKEVIDNLKNSQGMMSLESIVAKHPYVQDPQMELERVRKEKEDMFNQFNQEDDSQQKQDDEDNNQEE